MTQLASVVRSRTFAGTTAAAACLTAIVTVGATGAHGETAHQAPAGSTVVTGGALSWGVKASFAGYLSSPIANGKITPSNGASVANNVVTYSGANGAITKDGDLHVAYKGAARYYGHEGVLDFTLSDPYVSLKKSGSGDLYVMYAVGKAAPQRVRIATLTGAPVVSGSTATINNAKAALTTEGAKIFAYQGREFYKAGSALDAVNSKIALKAATSTTTTAPKPTQTSKPAPTQTSKPAPSQTSKPATPKPSKPATSKPSKPAQPTGPATGPVVETDIV